MGGGNANKSMMKRQKNLEKAAKEAAGGGGAAGIKARQADPGLSEERSKERAKVALEREQRAQEKKERELAVERKAAKAAGKTSGANAATLDKEAMRKKKAAAAAALAAAGGAPPPKKTASSVDGASEVGSEATTDAATPEVDGTPAAADVVNDGDAPPPVVHQAEVEIPQRPPLSAEEAAALRERMAAREKALAERAAKEAAEAVAEQEAKDAKAVRARIAAKKVPRVSADDFELLLSSAKSSAAKEGSMEGAAEKVLADLLASAPAESLLARALAPDDRPLRAAAIGAALEAARLATASNRAEAAYAKLEAILDAPAKEEAAAARVSSAVYEVMGACAGELPKAGLLKLKERALALFGSGATFEACSTAAIALGAALKTAVAKGTVGAADEPTALLAASLEGLGVANSAAESRVAAHGLGAAVAALGEASLGTHGVYARLVALMGAKSPKEAAFAAEAATLAAGQLCIALRFKFEPYAVPLLPTLMKLLADKDKKVADAATLAARAAIGGLSHLSVESVVGALYDGMQVVGGGGRVKIEALKLASILAERAPTTMGPCLPQCIPLVIECINDSNAKVQAAGEAALPVLCSCVVNAEVANTLKDFILTALRRPDTTLDCIDEVLMTTFCNPMDGTSLAFMMPIILRGIKDSNYELVKKATVCASNLCALIKESSDIAPFVPELLPLFEKNVEHSSPVIREATVKAKEKLLEGAGDLVDPKKRHRDISAAISAGLSKLHPELPREVPIYLGETGASMLQERLGGVVRVQYFREAPGQLADWIFSELDGLIKHDADGVAAVASAAVDMFRDELPADARAILDQSADKDFALDMQNMILAFAGRVLLRKADVRFERGHRYGLVGQNGTGKTTLLNRLAAKDINGFPQELRTHYIRHEVLCDDGVTVRDFLLAKCPAERRTNEAIEEVFVAVSFPDEYKDTYVNSLSGGWKMRMSIAISILHQPELLLLDEPTNHLDREAIDWLTAHLLGLEGVTIAVVSHDYDFINDVCTDITHYDNGGQLGKPCRFVYYPMTFNDFQTLKPEIAAGLPRADKGVATAAGTLAENKTPSEVSEADPSVETATESMDRLSVDSGGSAESGLSTTLAKVDEMIAAGLILPMNFPDPGKPEGIRTFRKPILTLSNVSFKYPETDRYILKNADASLTLGSRAVIVGGNGSGKSTFLKLIIGDLEHEEPEEGSKTKVWRHHALRLSYVAQQSLHHLEDYVTQTPIQYIQARFRQGLDAEVAKLKSITLTDEEKELMNAPSAVHAVVGRTVKGRQPWYEMQTRGRVASDTINLPLAEIEIRFPPYVQKLIKNFDQKAQALESGMAIRPITEAEVLTHLADFGIDQQLAFGKIRQMSGGQRQRLVICAAFWSKPHVIALDEPTNYLDNDSVAALTKALKDFKGAVVTVSENEAFVAEISNEKWVVENGGVTCVQLRAAKAR